MLHAHLGTEASAVHIPWLQEEPVGSSYMVSVIIPPACPLHKSAAVSSHVNILFHLTVEMMKTVILLSKNPIRAWTTKIT